MPLFGKERHGTMSELVQGRQYCWTIPKFLSYPANTCLDSEYVTAFTKAKFHFHMTIGRKGDVGFYLHYRDPPIPKYSYYVQNALGETMRNQTAHTIPPDAERCGHWNMANAADAKDFLSRSRDDTLYVYFTFDDDTVVKTGVDDVRVTWTVPNLLTKRLNPLTSPGFSINGSLYVIRMDVKSTTDEYVFFVFCRKGTLPPHSLAVASADGSIVAQLERRDELGAQTLLVPKVHLDQSIGRGSMVVTLVVFKNANPLDFFNIASGASGGVGARSPSKPQYAEVGSEQYIVFNDEL